MSQADFHPSRKMKKLSVVFSFRNEEDVLSELIRRTRTVLRQLQAEERISSYELIFVDDASTDRSWDILIEQAKGYNDIRIIRMSRCFGPSPSPGVLAGMEYSSGDVVVYMDADLQDPPVVISQLLSVWQSDPEIEVVHTVRQSRLGESTVKLFLTKLGYGILNKVTSIRLPIEAGDFKLLSRRAVNHLIQLREKRPFLRGLVCWIGFKQAYLPYHRESRHAGESKFHVLGWDVISNFLDSALISFSSAPLKLTIFLGFFAILADFGLLIHVISEKVHGKAIPGWTAIMIAIIFIGSVQLLCLGIMGLYLNAIFEESKARPNYIIDRTFGFSNQRRPENESSEKDNSYLET